MRAGTAESKRNWVLAQSLAEKGYRRLGEYADGEVATQSWDAVEYFRVKEVLRMITRGVRAGGVIAIITEGEAEAAVVEDNGGWNDVRKVGGCPSVISGPLGDEVGEGDRFAGAIVLRAKCGGSEGGGRVAR